MLHSLADWSLETAREKDRGDEGGWLYGSVSNYTPAVPVSPEAVPEADDEQGGPPVPEAGPRPKCQAQPNKRVVGPEWDM
jgi:hypothetical protein